MAFCIQAGAGCVVGAAGVAACGCGVKFSGAAGSGVALTGP